MSRAHSRENAHVGVLDFRQSLDASVPGHLLRWILDSAEHSSTMTAYSAEGECAMIDKFGSLFAGHIDLDNIGFAGTAANDRFYSNDRLITVFDKTEAMCTLMDDLGYDVFWMAEHHFQPEGYECIPNILQLSVHLAHITKQIKFGCGFNIAPMWHPLRMAEDFATADILTGGRVIFGVGRGYHTREVEAFGAPMMDADANRDLFEEQVEVMYKSFNEESFSHHGKHYTIPPEVPYRGYTLKEITLVPRPVNLPVECWQPIVSASDRGLNFMAKYGIKGIIGGGAAPGGASEKVVREMAGGPGGSRQRDRAWRRPDSGHLLLHRRLRGGCDTAGEAVLRGEHEDVRPSRIRPRSDR